MLREHRSGFTLVELLVFTAIIAIMSGALVGFSLVSSNIATRTESIAEVEQNADLVLQRISHTVSELADRIAYPPPGVSATSLLLARRSPATEWLFELRGNSVEVIENGTRHILTTNDVKLASLHFLHFGTPGLSEGVSTVFDAWNPNAGIDLVEKQYTKTFRGTALMRAGAVCVADSDCTTAPFTKCCSGVCKADPECDGCVTDSDCSSGQVCCTQAGDTSCMAEGSCTTPQCLTVADCPSPDPFCDQTGGACDWKVPSCSGGSCTTVTVGRCPECSRCGDGWVDAAALEECDDGDIDNKDSCTMLCQSAFCGDGFLWNTDSGSEQCDDGNTLDGDGCSNTCQNEDLCRGGSANGTVEGNEECDDGNATNADTCDNNCRVTTCGDGMVQSPNGLGVSEQCDDGNTLPWDGCSTTCQTETSACGDGNLDGGETCDDGKRCSETGDSCSVDDDCPGVTNLCAGKSGDGCTTENVCVVTENPEATCSDSLDNDCDGSIDCADTANCTAGTSCGANGRQCSGGACTCPGGQSNESTCNDGSDNDCDGSIDCADADCNGLTCDTGKTCQSGSCQASGGGSCGDGTADPGEECNEPGLSCGGGQLCNTSTCLCYPVGTTQCSNGLDDDGAQGTDCADPDCLSATDWVRYELDAMETSSTSSFRLVDVDSDGDMDIVLVKGTGGFFGSSGEVLWYESNGAQPPVFTQHASFGGPIYASQTVYVDAGAINDEDTFIDVVAAGYGQIDWFKNDGSQNFTQYSIPTAITTSLAAYIVDWNSDGQKDILVFDSDGFSSGAAYVYENNGSESFTERILVSGLFTGGHYADFNGDGRMDILTGDSDSVDWYRNVDNSTVPFPLGGTVAVTAGSSIAVFAENLDGDSDKDIIASDSSGTHWYQNNGAGVFTTKPDISASINAASIYATDVDQDTDVDVLAAVGTTAFAFYSSGGSNPTFSAEQTILTSGSWYTSIRAGNLKNDGDIVAVGSLLENGSIYQFVEWYDFVGAGQCYNLDNDESS